NEVPWAIETGWHTGDGDDWLRRGGVKLFSDGALGSHTSHMSSPFPEPEPGSEAAAGAGTASDASAAPDAGTDAYGVAPATMRPRTEWPSAAMRPRTESTPIRERCPRRFSTATPPRRTTASRRS